MGFCFDQNPTMDVVQAIAQNLSAWMERSKSLKTLDDVAKASGVGFGTVQRIRRGEGNPSVRNLESLAKPFGARAIDLLADPDAHYNQQSAVNVSFPAVKDPPAEERELLLGYRVASHEVREIMLDLARKATVKKDFDLRSEKND